MRRIGVCVAIAGSLACGARCTQPQHGDAGNAGRSGDIGAFAPGTVHHLASTMAGSYSSQAQALADPEFRDIRLHMTPIWIGRADGPWLYVEQAAATSLDRPYRQRVYQLVATPPPADDPEGPSPGLESRVFELPGDPLAFAGAWRDPARFDALSPDDLLAREGCTVHLSASGDGSYEGSTVDEQCLSTLRGAAYATSEVFISSDEIRTWDRGFDKEGKQVWGAVKGPYRFGRVSPTDAAPTPAAPPARPAAPDRAEPM